MKRNILFVAVIGFMVLASCDDAVKDEILAIPANVGITVEGRWVTVSWDAVPNASGYEVYTATVGCPSGNRISNTASHSFTNHDGGVLTSEYPTNGSVEFHGATSIKVWLMAATSGDTTLPMATSVSAKVKAISTNGNYLDSDYSAEVSIDKDHYQPADDDDDDDDDHGGHHH